MQPNDVLFSLFWLVPVCTLASWADYGMFFVSWYPFVFASFATIAVKGYLNLCHKGLKSIAYI